MINNNNIINRGNILLSLKHVVILINQNEKVGKASYENNILHGNTELWQRTVIVYTKTRVYSVYDFRTLYNAWFSILYLRCTCQEYKMFLCKFVSNIFSLWWKTVHEKSWIVSIKFSRLALVHFTDSVS